MKTVITHFDGDPFILTFWLYLYEKYWRGEVDTIEMSICYNPDKLPQAVIDYNTSLLKKYKEIALYIQPTYIVPELANQSLLQQTKADAVGLIESDGLIFEKGLIDRCFKMLDEYDIVAPTWNLIANKQINEKYSIPGFMRCFFFAKMATINKTDKDFLPKHIKKGTEFEDTAGKTVLEEDINLDCFGWMSLQLLFTNPRIKITPNNIMTPDTIFRSNIFDEYKWLHIRQMSSSTLGINGQEYSIWQKGGDGILNHIFRLFNEEYADGGAEFIHLKSVAFKMLFYETLVEKEKLGVFADEYKFVLESVIEYLGLNRIRLAEITGYYKGLMQL